MGSISPSPESISAQSSTKILGPAVINGALSTSSSPPTPISLLVGNGLGDGYGYTGGSSISLRLLHKSHPSSDSNPSPAAAPR